MMCSLIVLVVFLLGSWTDSVVALDKSFFGHAGAKGTQHNRPKDDPNFLKSNSEMPILPVLHGYTGTHGKVAFLVKMKNAFKPVKRDHSVNTYPRISTVPRGSEGSRVSERAHERSEQAK